MLYIKESVLNEEDTHNDYPAAAKKNAQMAIDWKEEHGRDEVEAGTPVGWARAHQLAKGENLSTDTVKRMSAFNRHRKNSSIKPELKETPWKDRGYVAWLIWGGDEGVDWAIEKSKEIDAMEESNQLKYIKPLNEAEKYITDKFKVGDKINTEFGEWEVIETDYAPKKRFTSPFIFKGDDMKRLDLNAPPTNKQAVGYKVTDGDKYPIIGFLYQYKDITKLATIGVDESVTEAESNFETLLATSEDESIGRKIRLGGKRDPGQEVWQKVDRKFWMNLKTKKKLDLNKWAKHADEFHMAGKDLQFESKVNEASKRKVHKAAKQGSYPAVIVVVQDGKVIHQEPVSTPDVAPATFSVMQERYPKAVLHLEDNTGKRLFSESVNEAKAVKVTKKEWPYVEFKDGGKTHKVEFDYEDIIDDHGNEGQDQYWLGKDDNGQEWMIDVYASRNGDVEEVHYDTIVKESVVNEDFPGKGETVKAKDLNHEMLDYFNRMNISLSINTKSKKNIKGSVGTMFNDLVFNGGDIDKKDIVSVKIIESVVTEEVVYNSSNTKPEAAKKATKEFGKLLPKANKGVEPYVFAVVKTKARNYRLAIKSGSYVAHEFMTGLRKDGILTADIVKKAVANVIKMNPEEFNEAVVNEAKAYKLKASEFGADTHSAAYNVKGEPTWRVHSTYAIDQVSGENNPEERDVVFFEAMPINNDIYIKIGGINNLKRTNGATVGENFGTTIDEWKIDSKGIAKEASEFLTDATHLKWINKKARSEGQVIKWALKDDYSSVIEDLVNKSLGLKESVVTEGKMPNKLTNDDDIVFLKTSENSKGAHYNVYYKGHDIDFGGVGFGTEKQLNSYAKEYILSRQWYNKLRYEDAKPLPESVITEEENPCWDEYEVGEPKTKVSSRTGKRVNNCVPKKKPVDEVKRLKFIKPLSESVSRYDYDKWIKANGKIKYPKWIKVTHKEIIAAGLMDKQYDAEQHYMSIWTNALGPRLFTVHANRKLGEKEFGKTGYAFLQRFWNDIRGYGGIFWEAATITLELVKKIQDRVANKEEVEPAYYIVKNYFNEFDIETRNSRLFNSTSDKLAKWMDDNDIQTL